MKKITVLLLAILTAISVSAFTVDTITVASSRIPDPMRVTVITPDHAAADTLPAVWLLNGYGGDYRSWLNVRPDLGDLADRYGMVMVFPSGMDSWYWDSPVNPSMQMESFFVNDLVPRIRADYPVSRDPRLTAITGLSMGGHGALWLGGRHPEIWGNLGSTSGGVNIIPFPAKWKMAKALGTLDENPDVWRTHTVINMVDTFKKNGQNIIFDCGSDDFFHQVNADLHQAFLDAKVPHDYISRPGNHSGKYWANSILYQLLYFNQAFSRR